MENLNFDQSALRVHLLKCFNEEMFSPFPQTLGVLPKGRYNTVLLELFCCFMPESYDDMLCCDLCDTWFHYSCVGFKCTRSCAGNCICVPCVWSSCVLYAVLMIKLCVSLIKFCFVLKINFLTMTSTLMYHGAPLTFTEKILTGMFSANMVAMP